MSRKTREWTDWLGAERPAKCEDIALCSIIMRTRGDRSELLHEALLSVSAQSCEDYEVIVICHDCPTTTVGGVVAGLPSQTRARVQVIEASGGGRSRPLNAGLDRSRGRFVCFLDDDDLLMPNHIASVEECDADALHTFGSRRTISASAKATYPYATVGLEIAHARAFDPLDELVENHVPICNLFVRRSLIEQHALRFDETYELYEDWQFIMRVQQVAVIETAPVVTTVVNVRREGTNTINAPELRDAWSEARQRIRAEFESIPRLFSAKEVAQLTADASELERLRLFFAQNQRVVDAIAPVVRLARNMPVGVKSLAKRLLRRSS